MSLVVEFPDPGTARRCNTTDDSDRAWGPAGRDVRESLCVLAASPSLLAYDDHPNVAHEGDLTVYKGRTADVMLDLTAIEGPPPGVWVEDIHVRDRVRAT